MTSNERVTLHNAPGTTGSSHGSKGEMHCGALLTKGDWRWMLSRESGRAALYGKPSDGMKFGLRLLQCRDLQCSCMQPQMGFVLRRRVINYRGGLVGTGTDVNGEFSQVGLVTATDSGWLREAQEAQEGVTCLPNDAQPLVCGRISFGLSGMVRITAQGSRTPDDVVCWTHLLQLAPGAPNRAVARTDIMVGLNVNKRSSGRPRHSYFTSDSLYLTATKSRLYPQSCFTSATRLGPDSGTEHLSLFYKPRQPQTTTTRLIASKSPSSALPVTVSTAYHH